MSKAGREAVNLKSSRWVDGIGRRLVQALLPPCCVLCGGTGDDADLCAGCAAALPGNADCCASCGLPLACAAPACGACLAQPPPWSVLRVPFRYAWPLDRLVARYKFAGDLAAGAVLAQCLAAALGRAGSACDAVVPVPLSGSRLRERGFNQALELARPVARALGVPLAPHLLARARDTAAQSGLDAAARHRNVRGAFVAAPGCAGLRIALVDDVVTTGATLAACAHAVRAAGAASVEAWAVARALPPGAQPVRSA